MNRTSGFHQGPANARSPHRRLSSRIHQSDRAQIMGVSSSPAQDVNSDWARENQRDSNVQQTDAVGVTMSSLGTNQASDVQRVDEPRSGARTPLSSRIKIPGFNRSRYGLPRSNRSQTTGDEASRSHENKSFKDSANSQVKTDLPNISQVNAATSQPELGAPHLTPTPYSTTNTSGSHQSTHAPQEDLKSHEFQPLPSPQQSQRVLPSMANPLASNPVLQNSAISNAPKLKMARIQPQAQPVQSRSETKEEILAKLQEAQLNKIASRTKHKGGIPETTSLRDLELARRPPPEPIPRDQSSIPTDLQKSITSPQGETQTPQFPTTIPQLESNFNLRGKIRSQSFEQYPANPPKTRETVIGTEHTLNMTPDSTIGQLPNSRWATSAEIRPEPIETDSNAWGSEIPSNAETASGDSLLPMYHGKMFRNKQPAVETSLAGWDGKWQPPPVDWHQRARFNNSSPEFTNGFNNWLMEATDLSLNPTQGISFTRIPHEYVQNLDLHPDGLGFVDRHFVINLRWAEKYGYRNDMAEIMLPVRPLSDHDLEDWGKLDMNNDENRQICEETTEFYVKNWVANKTRCLFQQPATPIPIPIESSPSPVPSQITQPKVKNHVHPHAPTTNIYLRPCVSTDIPELTTLYNMYVKTSPRTTELSPIDTVDMADRLADCTSARLPFIVACPRVHKALTRVHSGGGQNVEKVVGFALAIDFSDSQFAERLSAELEVYVHPQWLRKGVGKCLMDKLLQALDRGYMAKGGYPFACDPTIRHCYEAGGYRDIHLMIFVIRHYQCPNPKAQSENDVSVGVVQGPGFQQDTRSQQGWLMTWLTETWGFEWAGMLKGVGAKGGRFTNITYLTKKTAWQPEDGKIPEALEWSSD